MDTLDISIEDRRWQAAGIADLAEAAITATLQHLDIRADDAEVSLLACDDAQIAALTADFRGKPQPTNVLSWPSEERGVQTPGEKPLPPKAGPDGMIALGDIAIAYDTCVEEARNAGKPVADHATHLIVHATLHLLGYDHENEPDAAVMEGLEVKILGKMGLDDPYKEG